jgi:hypothetical protein
MVSVQSVTMHQIIMSQVRVQHAHCALQLICILIQQTQLIHAYYAHQHIVQLAHLFLNVLSVIQRMDISLILQIIYVIYVQQQFQTVSHVLPMVYVHSATMHQIIMSQVRVQHAHCALQLICILIQRTQLIHAYYAHQRTAQLAHQ